MSVKKSVVPKEKSIVNKSIQLWFGEDQSLLSWEAQWWRNEFKKRQPDGLVKRLSYQTSLEQDLLLQLQQTARGGNLWSAAVYLELTGFLQTSSKTPLAELLLEIINNPPQNLFLLLLEEGKVAWSKVLPKKIKALSALNKVKQRDFSVVSTSGRLKWLNNQAKNLSVDLSVQSANGLLGRCGNDCWRLSQELNKLAAYTQGRPVSLADIDLLVEPVFMDSSFALLEALAKRDINQAVAIMDRQFKSGDSPQSLIGMLAWHLRVLTGVRQALDKEPANLNARQLAVDLKLHPFVVNKALQQMPYYSAERIKDLWQALTIADLKLKTTSLPPATVLSVFFVTMSKLNV
ncbi:DNA polymerase III subunit delta [Patescibacteria group bacterium]|nr:DNA polymerase III subunit delta [Patescibacteria group bacterium]